MGRRKDANTPTDGILTGIEYEAAQTKIASLKRAAVYMALEGATMPYDQMRRAMFDPEVLRAVDHASKYSNAYGRVMIYDTGTSGVSIRLNPQERLSIKPQCFAPQSSFAGFQAATDAAAVQYDRFELVSHVLKWFNKKATPGMARYYWPCIKTLCDAGRVPLTMGSFRDNPDVQMLLPDIRATSETLAAAALMPETPPLTLHGDMALIIQRSHPVYGQGTSRIYPL